MLSVTYVIGDMYSASLTSILARPPKELSQLVTRQREYLIGSTEKGMQLVRDNKNYAVIGGRETFYYDIKRFGAQHFHLSEKLNTRYSAIAFQRACPYRDNFDDVHNAALHCSMTRFLDERNRIILLTYTCPNRLEYQIKIVC
ncbi:ionotropic receptor 40a isoform X2, partial [Aphis craccivora]